MYLTYKSYGRNISYRNRMEYIFLTKNLTSVRKDGVKTKRNDRTGDVVEQKNYQVG